MWTVLCFGWWVVSVRVVRMLGSRTVREGTLYTVLVLIEDFHFTNLRCTGLPFLFAGAPTYFRTRCVCVIHPDPMIPGQLLTFLFVFHAIAAVVAVAVVSAASASFCCC